MRNVAYILITIIILIGLIALPYQCIEAAKNGLDLCQKVIIPSLFPFFVCSKLLIQLGFVAILGKKCSWLMRPLFHVPGSGAFAFCLGILSGYPVGAKAVSELYEQKLCTKTEAERLLAFCNNSGPLFIIGAVGTGLFHSPSIGFLLYFAHILSALTIGFVFRFYKRKEISNHTSAEYSPVIVTAGIGELFGKAILDSVISIAVVCGFILFFSVLLAILQSFEAITFLSFILHPLGLSIDAAKGFSYGFFEITNGIKQLSPNPAYLTLTGFLLAWSGISVILQVAGIIGKHRLSIRAFMTAKLLQGIFASFYTFLFTMFLTEPAFSEATKSPPGIYLESRWIVSVSMLFLAVVIYTGIAFLGHRFKAHTA